MAGISDRRFLEHKERVRNPTHPGRFFGGFLRWPVVDGRYIGLAIDQRTQGMYTDERIDAWVAQVKPLLLEKLSVPA